MPCKGMGDSICSNQCRNHQSGRYVPGCTLAANTLNDFRNQLLTEMRNEMKKVLVAATTAVATGSGARGGDTAKDGGQECWRKTRSDLPLCPTARGMESITRRIVSYYQQMQTRSPLTSSTGDTSMGKRRNDISRGKIVIAQIRSG